MTLAAHVCSHERGWTAVSCMCVSVHTQAASADALAAHVRHVMVDFKPLVGSEMYTGHTTRAVLEDTLRLVMRYLPGPPILMDRNRVGTSGATSECLSGYAHYL